MTSNTNPLPADYSTPTSPEPVPEVESGWVPGDLPPAPEAVAQPEAVEAPPVSATRPNGYEAVVAASQEQEKEPLKRRKPRAPEVRLESSLPQDGGLSVEALVESLLFVAEGPVTVARLAEALEVTPHKIENALSLLTETYQQRGLSLQRFRDKVQLTSAPAAAPHVERFLGLAATTSLSKAALETLAIIAYQQPVTRPQIEAVRGVNSDSVIKNLLSKGLIEELGRTEGPGRPVLYSTTTEFLQHFGLTALNDLPPLSLEAQPTLPEGDAGGVEILKG